MIGSERLSQLVRGADRRPRSARSSTRRCGWRATELGADRVRAHAILHDDLGVYRDAAATATTSRRVDARLRPRARARAAPGRRALVHAARPRRGPGRDGVRVRRRHLACRATGSAWGELVPRASPRTWSSATAIDEVARWGFEVWNEANLEVFWTGTQDEYFRLYDVGGAGDQGRRRAAARRRPGDRRGRLDRRTSSTSSSRPARRSTSSRRTPTATCRSTCARRCACAGSTTSRSGGPSGASPRRTSTRSTTACFGATFVLHGMKSAQGRADALAYWVVSDHFEELGRPPRAAARRLRAADRRQPAQAALVGARARRVSSATSSLAARAGGRRRGLAGRRLGDARRRTARCDVLLWNGTLDQTKVDRRAAARPRGRAARRGPRARPLTEPRWPAWTSSTRTSPPLAGRARLADGRGGVAAAAGARPAARGGSRRRGRPGRMCRAQLSPTDAGSRSTGATTRCADRRRLAPFTDSAQSRADACGDRRYRLEWAVCTPQRGRRRLSWKVVSGDGRPARSPARTRIQSA